MPFRGTPRPNPWTDEIIGAMITLISGGYSASIVASKLAVQFEITLTRNSVIAKLNRLKDKGSLPPALSARMTQQKTGPRRQKRADGALYRPTPRKTPSLSHDVAGRTHARALVPRDKPRPAGKPRNLIEALSSVIEPPKNKRLLDLAPNDCRFIAGNDRLYCANPGTWYAEHSGPYCEGHRKLMYRRGNE